MSGFQPYAVGPVKTIPAYIKRQCKLINLAVSCCCTGTPALT